MQPIGGFLLQKFTPAKCLASSVYVTQSHKFCKKEI